MTDPNTFAGLAVLHGEDGVWVDRTISRDFDSGTICASVSSLSPFAVVTRKPYKVKPLFDTRKSSKSGSTIPLKVRILDPLGVNVSSAALVLRAIDLIVQSDPTSVSLPTRHGAPIEALFRYDSDLDGYIMNLRTDGLHGAFDLRFTIGADGRSYSVPFKVH